MEVNFQLIFLKSLEQARRRRRLEKNYGPQDLGLSNVRFQVCPSVSLSVCPYVCPAVSVCVVLNWNGKQREIIIAVKLTDGGRIHQQQQQHAASSWEGLLSSWLAGWKR